MDNKYKIRHIPTGLYYVSGGKKVDLTTNGKFYTRIPSFTWLREVKGPNGYITTKIDDWQVEIFKSVLTLVGVKNVS